MEIRVKEISLKLDLWRSDPDGKLSQRNFAQARFSAMTEWLVELNEFRSERNALPA
jgi:hypothetical protein